MKQESVQFVDAWANEGNKRLRIDRLNNGRVEVEIYSMDGDKTRVTIEGYRWKQVLDMFQPQQGEEAAGDE